MLGSSLSALLAASLAMPQTQEPAPAPTEPTPLTAASGRVQQPVELGQVRWRRDFDAALAEARRDDKPVLLLFQEVPG